MIGPGHAQPQDVVLDDDVADTPGSPSNAAVGTRAGEAQLDLVVGEVAQVLDAVDLDQPAVADDRDPVAGPLDLGQDVAREEDRPALGLRLADQRVERLLDERIEARTSARRGSAAPAGAGGR